MMSRLIRMTLFFLPALLCILLLDQLPGQDAENKLATLKTKGIISAIGNGRLQVKTADGGQWVIVILANKFNPSGKETDPRQVEVKGSALPSWLSTGMFVKFSAVFDENGVGQQPINQLVVFTPSDKDKAGAFRSPGGNAGELFSDEPAKKTKPKKKTVNLDIAGQLSGYRDGTISVNVGLPKPLRVQVAEKCTITVSISGMSFKNQGRTLNWYPMEHLRVGDIVAIDAWYPANKKAAGIAYANSLKVTAKETFARPKPAGKRPARKEPEGKPKPDDDKPDDDKEKKPL